MKVTVIGVSEIKGNSKKTGNPFHMTVVHAMYQKKDTRGYATEQIKLSAKDYPATMITDGLEYSVDRDSNGFVIDFSEIK